MALSLKEALAYFWQQILVNFVHKDNFQAITNDEINEICGVTLYTEYDEVL